MTGIPVVAPNADGQLEVFGLHKGGTLQHIWQTRPGNGWSAWESLAGSLGGDPAVAQNADGRLEVFVYHWTDVNTTRVQHIWQTAPNSGWSKWSTIDVHPAGRPAAAQNADGHLEVFAREASNHLEHAWQRPLISGWVIGRELGGMTVGDPAVGWNPDGRLEVFAVGPDGTVQHVWQTAPNNGWSKWESRGGSLTGGLAVAPNADGRLEVFGRGPGNTLQHSWMTRPQQRMVGVGVARRRPGRRPGRSSAHRWPPRGIRLLHRRQHPPHRAERPARPPPATAGRTGNRSASPDPTPKPAAPASAEPTLQAGITPSARPC